MMIAEYVVVGLLILLALVGVVMVALDDPLTHQARKTDAMAHVGWAHTQKMAARINKEATL